MKNLALINDFDHFSGLYRDVLSSGLLTLTNLFPEESKIKYWINAGLQYHREGSSLFLLRNDNGFKHLYFCSESLSVLKSESRFFEDISDGIIVADLIGKGNSAKELTELFNNFGFNIYTRLFRMFRIIDKTNNDLQIFNTIEAAGIPDVEDIQSILYNNFDPLCEQIPSIEELKDAVANKNILVVREGGIIIGLIYFEIHGLTSYLRYWYVDENFRNSHIGSDLYKSYFNMSEGCKRMIFWVIESNQNAIKRYMHYGYKFENLEDSVIINRKDKIYERKDN